MPSASEVAETLGRMRNVLFGEKGRRTSKEKHKIHELIVPASVPLSDRGWVVLKSQKLEYRAKPLAATGNATI